MILLDFKKNYILDNGFVQLRPLQADDFKHLLAYSINEPELWKYSLTPAHGEDGLRKYITMAIEARAEEEAYPFIVYDKRFNTIAGATRFYDFQQKHQTVSLGYTWYGKDFQGTGLNKNSKFLMLQFAFEHMKVQRVEFRADNKNKRSIAAMKSIGCTEEGVLRSNCASPDGRRDSIVLSILRYEWFSRVKRELLKKL
ncbi:GNAT family protein [uncultured Kordia sp.]|uniref:GNAT family N-acetyltransferase n=1 Tax=uncultured Kordia sp. TaxID=507699 RepID=UPI0026240F06|nr:GNAT family protein [uncultured Kordia sp.]